MDRIDGADSGPLRFLCCAVDGAMVYLKKKGDGAMARKAKKRVHPMPKLGWKDNLLYWSAMILIGCGWLASIFAPVILCDEIAFADERVVANVNGDGILHCFWMTFWFGVVLIFLVTLYERRLPVFGRTDIKYGPPAYPRTYPLLMKDKPYHWESPKKIAGRKKLYTVAAVVLVSTLLFSLAMYPTSLYSRQELHRDGTVAVYRSENEVEHYKFSQIEAVRLDTYRTGGKGVKKWTAAMVVCLSDGEEYRFSVGSFRGGWSENLRTMLDLKARYGSLVIIEGTEDLWRVAEDQKLEAAEEALLYELFGSEP